MGASLKTGFAQIFSCCPKNLRCPKFGGVAAPLAPPARTPMISCIIHHQPSVPTILFCESFITEYLPDENLTETASDL